MTGNHQTDNSQLAEQPFLNLLLVEDSLEDAHTLQDILKQSVFSRSEFTHVKRVWDAIALLHKESFDVILLDLTLPEHPGLAALDLLRQQAPDLPILTLMDNPVLTPDPVQHGAEDYLVKPDITPDLLGRSLRYSLQRKQDAEALREANEILERRVEERTFELKAANRQLHREVEHRQHIQERLELAQKVGKIGTFEWNLQSHEVVWSPELEALYGKPPGSFDSRHSCWLETLHPDDRLRTEQELWQAIQCGHGLETEFRILLSTGEIRWIAVKSSLFHDENGSPRRMIGIHMDVTEKKQFEIQFLRAQRLESLGTLSSGIAHDLNNVFTPILGAIQLLPSRLTHISSPIQELLEVMERSTQRGTELVRQILAFTHGIEGKRINLQVHHVLLESQTIIEQTFPKSIAIEVDVPTDLWMVLADVTQLHQVFMNLLVNARDAMPEGGVLTIVASNQILDELQVRAHPDALAGNYVVVSVQDTGVGIPPDNLHRIFDPFFTTKKIQKGTGLGLSAVIGIVNSHGGFVEVKSKVRVGSTFTVYLPAAQVSPLARPEADLGSLTGQRNLVLVVDDESAICDIVKTMLESFDYQVITADNGAAAIALFAQHYHYIDHVLMDMMMPGMDGAELLLILRQFNPHVRAIAMSGVHSIDAIVQAEKNGFQSFLPKPFETRELLQLLSATQRVETSVLV